MIFERRAGSGLKILVVFCSALAILTSLGLVAIFLVAMKSISDWEGVQVFQGLTMLLCPVSVLVFSIVMLLCFHCLTRNGARSKKHAIELLAVYGTKKSFEKLESFVDASKPAFTQRGLLHAIDQIKSRQ